MKTLNFLIAATLFVSFQLSAQGQSQSQENTVGCVISDNRTYVKIAGNTRTVVDSVEMTVLDRRGERFTGFFFQYSKGDRVTVNYAYITDAHGNVVRKLKNSDIEETGYSFGTAFYNDEFTKHFDLRHNTYPYKISYCVTHTSRRFLHIGGLAPSGRCNIEAGVYTVEVPAGYPLKIHSRNMDAPRKTGDIKSDKYVWRYKYDYQKPEVNASPASDPAPYLTVLPEKFMYGVPGSYQSWESFGEWAWRLNSGLDELPDSEKARIDAMLADVTETREKVRTLYHYLQDYNRYVLVDVNLGGYKSYPAAYVCANRFGDCKALCNYMRAILKYAGIESYYTLAYLDEQAPLFFEDFPSNVFNHIIVTVPLQNDTLFLDCTSKNLPFGWPGTKNQGRKALVTKSSGSRLTDVPAMTSREVASVWRFRVKCPDDRTSTINLDAKLRGEAFEYFLSLGTAVNKNDVEQHLRNHSFGGVMQMTDYKIERPHRDTAFVELHVEGIDPGFYRVFGETMILNNMSFGLPAYEPPANRRSAVQLDLPLSRTVIIEYELDGITIAGLPDDISIESPWGTYSVVFEMSEGGLTVTKSLEVVAATVTLDEYPDFYDFVSRVRSRENSKYQISVLL